MNETIDQLHSRKSVRVFEDREIDEKLVKEILDAAVAAQNAVVAAWSLGIGSCYIGDILENCEEQRDILGIPEYVMPAVMLVFGYPSEQQKERVKPVRSGLKYIISENKYPEMDPDYVRGMLEPKSGSADYEDWIKAFFKRKYDSEFSREMSRSVEKYLEQYSS